MCGCGPGVDSVATTGLQWCCTLCQWSTHANVWHWRHPCSLSCHHRLVRSGLPFIPCVGHEYGSKALSLPRVTLLSILSIVDSTQYLCVEQTLRLWSEMMVAALGSSSASCAGACGDKIHACWLVCGVLWGMLGLVWGLVDGVLRAPQWIPAMVVGTMRCYRVGPRSIQGHIENSLYSPMSQG